MEERNQNQKFWKGILVGVLLTLMVAMVVVGAASGIWILGQKVNQGEKDSQAASGPGVNQGYTLSEDEKKLAEIGYKLSYLQQLIDKYYLFEDDEDRKDPIDWMYLGYVASLQDPYSGYYSAEEYKSLMESAEGEYCGVGVMVSQNVYTGIVTVIKVFKDAPADVAGMLPGDVITAVEGMDISGMDLNLVVSDHIKGEEGTDVTITVYRESVEDYVDLTMTRQIVQNPTVEYEMLENQIGYIALSSFDEVSTEQFITAIEALEEQGMERLIVDLRNNGGGVVSVAEAIADYLMPDGKKVVSFKGKAVKETVYVSEDGHEMDIPMVVLVNEQSASASEVLTGALKDHDLAVVVGTQTFGKGIAQGIFPLTDGSALKLTTAYYYVPSGKSIHEEGIEPDVIVELDKELKSMVQIPKEEDKQLQTAMDVLMDGEEAVKERLELEAQAQEETETEAERENDKTEESKSE